VWIAKFKVWHADSAAVEASRAFPESQFMTYYLNNYDERGETFINKVAITTGARKSELLRRLAEDPRLVSKHADGAQLFYTLRAKDAFHELLFDKTIFFTKPILVRNGFEYWSVASWDKNHLTALYERVKSLEKQKKALIEMTEVREEPLDLFLPNVLSRLTDKQREAVASAVRNGYYEYPRRVSLEALARKLGVPRTTLQSHLRKAERALVPAAASDVVV
jgi:predicted DNA binding protein